MNASRIVVLNVPAPRKKSTVKPPNKGHIGDSPVVPCREVVLSLLEGFLLNNFLKTEKKPLNVVL